MVKHWLRVVACAGVLGGCDFIIEQVGGAWDENPGRFEDALSPGAQDLIQKAFDDVPEGSLRDYHLHIVGTETDDDDPDTKPEETWVNEKLTTFGLGNLAQWLEGKVYMSSAGVGNLDNSDQQYLERLEKLIESTDEAWKRWKSGHHGKYYILGFDYNYDMKHPYGAPSKDGNRTPAPARNDACRKADRKDEFCQPNKDKSTFYVSNARIVEVAKEIKPNFLIPVISINPYRKDAVAKLEKWAKEGVRAVKWLPNAMGIDACDPGLKEYYCTMKANQMALITHVGEERAVEADQDQELGNPLRFRYPLALGVKVLLAHAASLGENVDFDNGGKTPGFLLFMRLMREYHRQGNLYGDISATTLFNRVEFEGSLAGMKSGPLLELMRCPKIHDRLGSGSDYPLPAINYLIHLDKFTDLGMLSADGAEARALREIYRYNPLLFDFVLKRTVHVPGSKVRLPVSVFRSLPGLIPEWRPGTPARQENKVKRIFDGCMKSPVPKKKMAGWCRPPDKEKLRRGKDNKALLEGIRRWCRS